MTNNNLMRTNLFAYHKQCVNNSSYFHHRHVLVGELLIRRTILYGHQILNRLIRIRKVSQFITTKQCGFGIDGNELLNHGRDQNLFHREKMQISRENNKDQIFIGASEKENKNKQASMETGSPCYKSYCFHVSPFSFYQTTAIYKGVLNSTNNK